MGWRQGAVVAAPAQPGGVALFLGGLLLMVLALGVWARVLARRLAAANIQRSLRRYNRIVTQARGAIPAWFALGLFGLGWGDAVLRMLGPVGQWSVETPAAVVGTLPALLAWCALWWSQYPAERVLREQSLLAQLEYGAPAYAPPPLYDYVLSNLRLQLLFIVVPVLMLLGAHDLVQVLILRPLAITVDQNPLVNLGFVLAATAIVFIIAPAVLRRVLHTEPLPEGPLRARLESLCRRYRLRYRQILLWRTHHNMGNAAVMGVVPQFRYILLSDLLLETMTPQQVEAVFAHELGHVVHRHMAWYVLFIFAFMFVLAGPGQWVDDQLMRLGWLRSAMPAELLSLIAGGGLFVAAFGYVSRRFERQADVFAARTMQAQAAGDMMAAAPAAVGAGTLVPEATVTPEAAPSFGAEPVRRGDVGQVGRYGAGLFASALHRVAVINGIPVAARSWCHGSIAKRMNYLLALADEPARTREFDRVMGRLRLALIGIVIVSGAWAMTVQIRTSSAAASSSSTAGPPMPAAAAGNAAAMR